MKYLLYLQRTMIWIISDHNVLTLSVNNFNRYAKRKKNLESIL